MNGNHINRNDLFLYGRDDHEKITADAIADAAKDTLAKAVDDLAAAVEKATAAKEAKEFKEYISRVRSYERSIAELYAYKYLTIRGVDSEWTRRTEDALILGANGSKNFFKGLYIDGEKVAPSNYTMSEEDGLTFEIPSSYLMTLAPGNHSFSVEYTYGTTLAKEEIDKEASSFFIAMADADITWDLGGGQIDGSTEPIVLHCKEGDVITVIKAPVREGYRFLYWKGSSYQPGQSYSVAGDHTFVAQWEKITEQETADDTSGQTGKAADAGESSVTSPEQSEQTEQKSTEDTTDKGASDSASDSEESTGSSSAHSGDSDDAKAKSPATGDEAHTALYTLTAAAAMFGLSLLRILQKKTNMNRK